MAVAVVITTTVESGIGHLRFLDAISWRCLARIVLICINPSQRAID